MKKFLKILFILLSIATILEVSKESFANTSPKVLVKTNLGDFVIEVNTNKAPNTAKNFLFYVKSGFYNNTIFHRVIDGFMVQGGGFTEEMREKKAIKKPLQNEAGNGLLNKAYTVAMARTSDPHSATTQFFINTVDNKFLDYKAPTAEGYGYCVFGEVIEGKNVIDRIAKVPTKNMGLFQDVPRQTVLIQSIKIIDTQNKTEPEKTHN